MTNEQRKSPRVQAIHLVSYGLMEGSQPQAIYVGRTLDVSATGLKVETSVELEPGQELTIDIAAGEEILQTRGRVVRSVAGAESRYETGIEIDPVTILDDPLGG